MSKNKPKKENANQKNAILKNAFDKKVKDFVGEMVENLKKNKEAYILICTALGLVINAIWNIACGIWYRGYADGLNIPIQFIQKDNHNILISILIFLGVAVFLFPAFYVIYKLAKLVYRKKCVRRTITIVSTTLTLNPVIILILYYNLPSTQEFIDFTYSVWIIISLSSLAFLLVYQPIIDILVDVEKKRTKDENSTSEGNQNENPKSVSKIIVGAKTVAIWIVAIISMLMAIYCIGRFTTSIQIDFDFIVDKYDYSFTYDGTTVYDNIILSETDELYYLSVCKISGSADNPAITIFPNYHSIVKKGDAPNSIIRKRFRSTHIEKDKCPFSDNNIASP